MSLLAAMPSDASFQSHHYRVVVVRVWGKRKGFDVRCLQCKVCWVLPLPVVVFWGVVLFFFFFFLFCEHGCALLWVSFVSSSVLFPGVLPEVVFRD